MKITTTYRPNAHARFRSTRVMKTDDATQVKLAIDWAKNLYALQPIIARDNGYELRVTVDGVLVYDTRTLK